jgi:toxin ParE1/3/4
MEIIWRRIALNDLENIRRYIAQENPAAGARIRAAIRNAVERLADHPYLGRSGRVEGTRELVIAGTPFIAVYRVLANRLRILAVIHGSRPWPERF